MCSQGCASDIPTHWYSLSTELNPYWSKTHVEQPEIEAYWQGLARKWDLYTQLVTFAEVTHVAWDAARSIYHIESTDTRTGVKSHTTAKIVISAVGVLFSPTLPDLKGISDFSGDMFHSARWNNSVDMKNKRVGVIGNGSSAYDFSDLSPTLPNLHPFAVHNSFLILSRRSLLMLSTSVVLLPGLYRVCATTTLISINGYSPTFLLSCVFTVLGSCIE